MKPKLALGIIGHSNAPQPLSPLFHFKRESTTKIQQISWQGHDDWDSNIELSLPLSSTPPLVSWSLLLFGHGDKIGAFLACTMPQR